jgi:hypothetical protein
MRALCVVSHGAGDRKHCITAAQQSLALFAALDGIAVLLVAASIISHVAAM